MSWNDIAWMHGCMIAWIPLGQVILDIVIWNLLVICGKVPGEIFILLGFLFFLVYFNCYKKIDWHFPILSVCGIKRTEAKDDS